MTPTHDPIGELPTYKTSRVEIENNADGRGQIVPRAPLDSYQLSKYKQNTLRAAPQGDRADRNYKFGPQKNRPGGKQHTQTNSSTARKPQDPAETKANNNINTNKNKNNNNLLSGARTYTHTHTNATY